jgi:hypothetical protein
MAFQYELPEPPFSVRPFKEMSLDEARRHFEWFISIAEGRRQLLLTAITETGGSESVRDSTPASLIPTWAWVSKRLKARTETKLTSGSLALVLDTGFLLADIFFRQFPGKLHWVLWTRKTGPHNKPVIDGFKVPLVPSDVVKACAWEVLRSGPQDDLLYQKYQVWAKDLEFVQ